MLDKWGNQPFSHRFFVLPFAWHQVAWARGMHPAWSYHAETLPQDSSSHLESELEQEVELDHNGTPLFDKRPGRRRNADDSLVPEVRS